MKKITLLYLLLIVLGSQSRLIRYQRQRHRSPKPSGKYRTSHTTGVRIALPSK
jgi:hypothetical protein